MKTLLFAVTSVDPSIGKIDKFLLSQQTLMELLIGGLTMNRSSICTDIDIDISEWKGVIRNSLNEIYAIFWTSMTLRGSIELPWLPLSVTQMYVRFNRLSGTVYLTCLPDRLEMLDLSRNCFAGTINLTKLPLSLNTLALGKNLFVGEADFCHLPKSLHRLDVENTQISGKVYELDGQLTIQNSLVKDMRKK